MSATEPSSPKGPDRPPKAKTRTADTAGLEGLAEFVGAVMVAAVGGSAAVVAALGQFALALVLAAVALGILLRVWRLRRDAARSGSAERALCFE